MIDRAGASVARRAQRAHLPRAELSFSGARPDLPVMLQTRSPASAEPLLFSRPARCRFASAALAAILLLFFLIAVLPLFICMPLWVDTIFFDICARTVLDGGVLYRDILLHGPPGMVLIVSGLRALFGWRSEVLRLVDALIVSGCIVLLVRAFLPERASRGARFWTSLLMATFYFSTSEWTHCQPDVWMLLPGLAALVLVGKQVSPGRPRWNALGWGALEGILWGIAIDMKPFIIVPAACGWIILTVLALARDGSGAHRRLIWYALSVCSGMALVAFGVAFWLWVSGNGRPFLDVMFGSWNREYFQTSSDWAARTWQTFTVVWPWGLLHLLALPAAFWIFFDAWKNRSVMQPACALAPVLLAGFYLGWMFQANAIQRQTPYQLAPPILLAIAVLASLPLLRWPVILVTLAYTLPQSPLLHLERLTAWPRCWREGSSAALRDRLTLERESFIAPDWQQLETAKEFLQRCRLRDRELTCYSMSTISLYLDLRVKPSTRYVLLQSAQQFFPMHREQIGQEVVASPERYVIYDLCQVRSGGRHLTRQEASEQSPGNPLALPPAVPAGIEHYFPFMMPMVFRAGRYVVYSVPRTPGTRSETAED